MNKELTSLDWQIYNILKTQNDWITQKELCLKVLEEIMEKTTVYNTTQFTKQMKEYCQIRDMSNDDFHNIEWRHRITVAIRKLNSSDTIQKIILSTGKGIKIATQEEYSHFIGRKIMSAVRHLQRVKHLADKASKDGQTRIVFGRERGYIEAFIKNFEDLQ